MRLSIKGRDKIIDWEGSEKKPYRDSAGLLTIGVGHLITKSELSSGLISLGEISVPYKNGLSGSQVAKLFLKDVKKYDREVSRRVKVSLNQNQHDALVSFCFNVGRGAFRESTLLRHLNKGGYDKVESQLMRWVHIGSKESKGLKNRRRKEIVLWNTPC